METSISQADLPQITATQKKKKSLKRNLSPDEMLVVSNATEHTKQTSAEKMKECIYCGKSFTLKQLSKHKVEEEKELKCKYCDITFDTLRLLRRHMYRYHKVYACKYCNLKFFKGAYEYHLSSVHRKRPECSVCSKTFANKLSLVSHNKKIHLGERENGRFKCHLCDYNAPDSFQYKIHLARHNKQPDFCCDHCGGTHYTKGELNKHIQAYHRGGFKCNHCDKVFRSPEYLKRHKAVHDPGYERKINFTCELCGRGYVQEYGFKRHMLRHKGLLSSFDCLICGKSFTSKSSLESHGKIHTGLHPFVCNFCGKPLKCQQRIMDHLKTHTGDKPYLCRTCGEKFAERSAAEAHWKGYCKIIIISRPNEK